MENTTLNRLSNSKLGNSFKPRTMCTLLNLTNCVNSYSYHLDHSINTINERQFWWLGYTCWAVQWFTRFWENCWRLLSKKNLPVKLWTYALNKHKIVPSVLDCPFDSVQVPRVFLASWIVLLVLSGFLGYSGLLREIRWLPVEGDNHPEDPGNSWIQRRVGWISTLLYGMYGFDDYDSWYILKAHGTNNVWGIVLQCSFHGRF